MYAYMHIYTVGEGNTCLHLCAFIYTTGNTIIAKSLEYTVIAFVVKYKHQPIICIHFLLPTTIIYACTYTYIVPQVMHISNWCRHSFKYITTLTCTASHTISEGNHGGSIPWLHDVWVEAIKSFCVLVDLAVVLQHQNKRQLQCKCTCDDHQYAVTHMYTCL